MRGDLGRVKLRNVWEMLKRMLLEMLIQVQHDRWMRVQKMLNRVQHDKIPVTLNVIQGLHKRLSDFEQKKARTRCTGFSTMDKLSKLLLILV